MDNLTCLDSNNSKHTLSLPKLEPQESKYGNIDGTMDVSSFGKEYGVYYFVGEGKFYIWITIEEWKYGMDLTFHVLSISRHQSGLEIKNLHSWGYRDSWRRVYC